MGCLEHALQLLRGELTDRLPGIYSGGEASLALEDVADPGDQGLVEQGVAEGAIRNSAEGAGYGLGIEILLEDVRSESGEDGISA